MASQSEISNAIKLLNLSPGPIDLTDEGIKRFIIRKKLLGTYGLTEEDLDGMSSREIDEMTEEIISEKKGELITTLNAELVEIQETINSVIDQAEVLYQQLITIPAALVAVSPTGPTLLLWIL